MKEKIFIDKGRFNKINHIKHSKDTAFAAVCTIPTIILFIIFVIMPVVTLFSNSLYEWSGSITGEKIFIGFENYKVLFHSENFWNAFKNTVFLIVAVTLMTIFLSLFFAAVLSKGKTKHKSFYRIVFYIPNILSIVVISAIFSAIYAPGYGVIANIYKLFGNLYTGWLVDSHKVMWCIAVAMVWQAVGYYMVMYIAGMDSIPDSLYEAADLDGATKWKQFFAITLPMSWEIIRVTLTFFVISTINMSFLFVTSMTQGSSNSHVLLTYMYEQAYNNSVYGYGMAIGSVLFIFAYALSIILQVLTQRKEERRGV